MLLNQACTYLAETISTDFSMMAFITKINIHITHESEKGNMIAYNSGKQVIHRMSGPGERFYTSMRVPF